MQLRQLPKSNTHIVPGADDLTNTPKVAAKAASMAKTAGQTELMCYSSKSQVDHGCRCIVACRFQ